MPPEDSKPIRSLNLAYLLPLPPRSGYDLRLWNLSKHLARNTDLTLVTRTMGDGGDRIWQEEGVNVHTLQLPRPPPWLKSLKGLRFLFSDWPTMAGGWYFHRMATYIDHLLRTNAYDIVVMEGIWMSVYWPWVRRSNGLKVLNHYDLESEALGRQAKVLAPGFKKWLYRNAERRMAQVEKILYGAANLTWVCSEREKSLLQGHDPAWNIRVAPNGVDCDLIRPLDGLPGRELLFVGALSYFPNKDGLLYFVQDILPLIHAVRTDVVFRIVGRNPGPDIKALHQPGKIEVTGEVDSLEPYYQKAAMCLVPLRVGGGTRLKILEAMAYGRPVVSTSLGAEGLNIVPERDYLVANDPPSFAKAILSLLSEPAKGKAIAQRARCVVEDRYNWSSIATQMLSTYQALLRK